MTLLAFAAASAAAALSQTPPIPAAKSEIQNLAKPANRTLYDLEQYLNIRGNAFAGFSHDGKWIYFLTGVTGTAQVWRVPIEGGWPEQITSWADRAQGCAPSPTNEWLLVSRDSGGNENSQLFLVKNDGSVIRDLTHAPDAKHDFGGWSWDGTKIAFSSNARTQKDVLAWRAAKKDGKAAGDEPPTSTDVYVEDVRNGARECVYTAKPGELFDATGFSPDGKKLLLSRANGSLDNDLFVLDLATKEATHLTPHAGIADYSADWCFDGGSLWVVTNEGREFHALLRMDVATRRVADIRAPKAEVEAAWTSRDGKRLVVGVAKDGGRELELIDVATMAGKPIPTGPGVPGGVAFLEGTARIGVSMNGPRDATDVYLFDAPSGAARRVTNAFLGGIPHDTFVKPEAVKYASFDGKEIEGLLYRPTDAAGPSPTIVEFHGGPEGQSRPQFNPLAQYFVSRGYALFQPNVRGSTGYGRTFTHLDDVRLREDSVKDGAAGVAWLAARGIADPKRVVCYGGSYGGYMVLASLTLNPEIWAAGVDVVGIANFVSFLENTSGYRRKLRESEYGAAGTANAPGADREFLATISPLGRVQKIQAPLLVIHGEQDPRVPVAEARQIEEALKKLGRPVEAMYYKDEGHGLAKLKNRLDCYPRVIAFLDRVLARE